MKVTIKNVKRLFLGLVILMLYTSCHNYYKALYINKDSEVQKGKSIDSLNLQSRDFILRNGNKAYFMYGITLSADQTTLVCTLDTLPPEHRLHLVKGRKGKMQYLKREVTDLAVLNEVHIYIPYDGAAVPGKYSLTLDKVQKMEVLQKDKNRTKNSYIIGAVGFSLGAAVVAGVIFLALKSSCPFVSAYNGNDFALQGEIYGGAIYPQLARHDFLPLKMSPLPDGTLQVKISNELKERQYTDMADLWVITHPKNTKVMADEKGNLYSIENPQLPVAAWLNTNRNMLSAIQTEGDNELLYMDDSSRTDAANDITLHFKKPAIARNARLVLSLKNSYWLDMLYGELAKGFGNYYASYLKQQQNKPVAELKRWLREQQIPLTVSLKTSKGWEIIDEITTIGPLAMRDMVVPVDLSAIAGESLQIRLSSGFMFWELDYAAMDFTEGQDFSIQKLAPVKATDELGKNILPVLQQEDGRYLEQPMIGNMATLVYQSSAGNDTNKTQSYILKTKGYYEHIRDFQNKPDTKFLQQFTKPNAFPVFGMALYKKVKEENIRALATSK